VAATLEGLVCRIEKIGPAVAPRFQEFFVGAMAIPHLSAPYPELRKVVALPEARAAKSGAGRRVRGRHHMGCSGWRGLVSGLPAPGRSS